MKRQPQMRAIVHDRSMGFSEEEVKARMKKHQLIKKIEKALKK